MNTILHILWLGPWFGDPHIVTTDGLSYTFNGEGEYLFTSIGNNETVIQARTERVKLSEGGGWFTLAKYPAVGWFLQNQKFEVVCDLGTKLQCQTANAKNPKTKNAPLNPKTPTPKHKSQWYFIHWHFFRGIQIGYCFTRS